MKKIFRTSLFQRKQAEPKQAEAASGQAEAKQAEAASGQAETASGMNLRKLFNVRGMFLRRNSDRGTRGRDPLKLFNVRGMFLGRKFSRERSQTSTRKLFSVRGMFLDWTRRATERQSQSRKLFSVRGMFLGVFLGLGLGALLSSGCLVELAERQGIGGTRDVTLGVANAVDRAANFLSLNRPSDGLSAALGIDTGGTVSDEALELLAAAMLPDPPVSSDPQGTIGTQPPSEGGGERSSGEGDAGSGEDPPTESTNGGGLTKNPEGSTTTASTNPTSTSSRKGTSAPTGKTDATTTSDPATGAQPPGTTEVTPPSTTTSPPTAPSTSTTPPGNAVNRPVPNTTIFPVPNTTIITTGNPPPPSPDPPTTTAAAVNPPPPPSPDPPVCPSTQAGNLPDAEFEAPRSPTPEEPLRIFVGGDSVSQSLAIGLQRLAPRALTKFEVASRVSTGLSRPDFYDWPARLARELTEDRPDVIVLMFGANDFQNVMYNGRGLSRFKQEWTDLYCQRVTQAMRLVSQPGVQIIWVGQPIMRESTLSDGVERLNAIYKSQALLHPSVTFIDTWRLFSTPNGEYAQSLDGVRLRTNDGVHMTIPGSNRLATPAWEQIAAAWGLES